MRKEQTERGFDIIRFNDSYGEKCSLQKSSLVVPCIWLGTEQSRMHLDRKQVLDLIPYLIGFVKTGELTKASKWEISGKMTKKQFLKKLKEERGGEM